MLQPVSVNKEVTMRAALPNESVFICIRGLSPSKQEGYTISGLYFVVVVHWGLKIIQVFKWKLLLNGEERTKLDWNRTVISGDIAVWKLEFPRLQSWGFLNKYVIWRLWHLAEYHLADRDNIPKEYLPTNETRRPVFNNGLQMPANV